MKSRCVSLFWWRWGNVLFDRCSPPRLFYVKGNMFAPDNQKLGWTVNLFNFFIFCCCLILHPFRFYFSNLAFWIIVITERRWHLLLHFRQMEQGRVRGRERQACVGGRYGRTEEGKQSLEHLKSFFVRTVMLFFVSSLCTCVHIWNLSLWLFVFQCVCVCQTLNPPPPPPPPPFCSAAHSALSRAGNGSLR